MNRFHRFAPTLALTSALALLVATPQTVSAMAPAAAEQPAEVAPATEAAPAPTQDPTQDQAAKHFRAGSAYFEAKRYADAEQEITLAYELTHAPELLLNLAQIQRLQGKKQEAVNNYEGFLQAIPDTPYRAEVQGHIESLQEELANPDPSETAAPTNDRQRTSNGRPLRIAGIAGLVAGVAALGVGIGFNVRTKNLESDVEGLEDTSNGRIPSDMDKAKALDLRDDGKRAQGVGIAMDVVGGALIVTGAVLLAVGIKRKRQGRQEAQARFRAAPNLGRKEVGLVFQGRF